MNDKMQHNHNEEQYEQNSYAYLSSVTWIQ